MLIGVWACTQPVSMAREELRVRQAGASAVLSIQSRRVRAWTVPQRPLGGVQSRAAELLVPCTRRAVWRAEASSGVRTRRIA